MTTRKTKRSQRIAALNDALRKNPTSRGLGRVMMTAGVHALGPQFVVKALAALAALTLADFRKGNDPYGERDFESFMVEGRKLFFKIEYFAAGSNYRCGAQDPSEPAATERVLTVMLAEEY